MTKDQAREACVLASGGIDSCALVADYLRGGWTVHPLYVRCGFFWERAELHWLKRYLQDVRHPCLRPLTISDAPMSALLPRRHWAFTGVGTPQAGDAWESVYLPARNLVLLSQAALFCAGQAIPSVALATLKTNPFSDARPDFRAALRRVLALSLPRPPRLLAPYARLTKRQVVARVPGAPLARAFVCLRPIGLRECGRCGKCEEKRLLVDARR